jgi:hypothetical protein
MWESLLFLSAISSKPAAGNGNMALKLGFYRKNSTKTG